MPNTPGTNSGHGYAWPRPDGVKARCGGPAMCAECLADLQLAPSHLPSIETVVTERDITADFRRFHNRLRMLLNIDGLDFGEAVGHTNDDEWATFRADPFRWFIRASDPDAEAVFALMLAREAARRTAT